MMEKGCISFEDPGQIDRLFHEQYQKLCYYASLIISDDVAAEDIVQDVFLSFVKNGRSFSSNSHVTNHLFIAVRNRCIDYKRKAINSRRDTLEKLATVADDADIDGDMIRAEVLSKISKMIDRLPRAQREVFRMAYIDNMSNQEIADTLGMSINTVKVDKRLSKAKLRDWLGDIYPILLLLFFESY